MYETRQLHSIERTKDNGDCDNLFLSHTGAPVWKIFMLGDGLFRFRELYVGTPRCLRKWGKENERTRESRRCSSCEETHNHPFFVRPNAEILFSPAPDRPGAGYVLRDFIARWAQPYPFLAQRGSSATWKAWCRHRSACLGSTHRPSRYGGSHCATHHCW